MAVPGYDFGKVPDAPTSDADFESLKKTVMWGEEDEKYRKMACEALKGQVEDILDLWYGWVGSNQHLIYYFGDKSGRPIPQYLEAVRKRFGLWIIDTLCKPLDRQWLNYMYEIGLRHHRTKKGKTDGVDTVEHIPLRYMIAFIAPIGLTIKPFLEKSGHPPEAVERMWAAWVKLVVLQVAIWSYPYAKTGEW